MSETRYLHLRIIGILKTSLLHHNLRNSGLTGRICREAWPRPTLDQGNWQNWTGPRWDQGAGWLQGEKQLREVELEELQVPAGSGVKDSSRKTDLLYNEYIVYDVAQVYIFHGS